MAIEKGRYRLHNPEPDCTANYDPARPVNLLTSLGILRHGPGDRTIRLTETQAWLGFATPAGDATLHISKPTLTAPARLQAWGSGARWAVASGPALLGSKDRWEDFDEPGFSQGLPEIVRRARASHRGLVLPSTGRLFEHAAGAILEQRVTGIEANFAWRWLVARLGRPAPGPASAELRIFPAPQQIAQVSRWEWQAARVDQQRAHTLHRLATVARSLQWWAEQPLGTSKPGATGTGTLDAALQSIPGIGPWTVAETLQRSHGSGDLISVGDFHLAGFVGQVLTGRRVDDEQMLELLEPYRPHRQRLVRLLQLSGERKQSFGPLYAPMDHRRH